MKIVPISQGIRLFLSSVSHKPYSKPYAKRLFDEICHTLENETDVSIVDDLKGNEEAFRQAAVETIVKRKSRTGKEFQIFNDFCEFIKEQYQVEITPIGPQMDTLERKMRVYNLLLDTPGITVEQISDELLVPISTIREDLGGLREGIHVADQHLTLGNGKFPIFLALDEKQVKNVLESVHPSIAVSILLQQTPYRQEVMLESLETERAQLLRALLNNESGQ